MASERSSAAHVEQAEATRPAADPARANVEREILDAAQREPLSVDWPEALRRARERYAPHGK